MMITDVCVNPAPAERDDAEPPPPDPNCCFSTALYIAPYLQCRLSLEIESVSQFVEEIGPPRPPSRLFVSISTT